MLRRFAVAVAMFSTISAVNAHEGHGHPEHSDGILHYVVNPSHSVVGLALCVAAVALVLAIRNLKRSR